tara:strand:+ start:551 stop:928 length:378 start_codon:yes stop_codon:yes gene_type:complete
MDVKPRFIKEAGYDIAEEFVETLQQLDIRTGIKIAKFIEKNVDNIPTSNLTSTVIGGVVIDDDGDPVTFALEVLKIKEQEDVIVLSDIQLVSMDEYLDLLNLNKKLNVTGKSKSNQKPNKLSLRN